jgi:hypothetical protein
MNNEDIGIKLNKNIIIEYLKKTKSEDLEKHYKFEETIKLAFTDKLSLSKFLASNKPIELKLEDDQIYFKPNVEGENFEIFTIDTKESFSESDKWFYNKIIPVPSVFSNAASSDISNEMSSFYICLIISSVFSGVFEEEFLEVIDTYDFNDWTQKNITALNFDVLYSEWIQIGSKTIKMIAAAAKYSLTRESQKKLAPSALGLSEAQVLALSNLNNQVSNIRHQYDEIRLAPAERSKMSKLDIKIIIKERETAIETARKADQKIYQIWRLNNLNSNHLDPNLLRDFTITARKLAPSVFVQTIGRNFDDNSKTDLIILKKINDKLKKEAVRASLNKLFASEGKKFSNDPKNYVAPNFV